MFGSFINVLIDRLPIGESIFLDRSHCAACKKKLLPYELIPVFSYLFLKGKCRNCKSKIPFRLLLVELLSGTVFVSLFLYFQTSALPLHGLIYLFIVSLIFIAVFFADLEYGIIPDELVVALLAVVLFYVLIFSPALLLNALLTGLGFSLFFLLLFIGTRGRGMGFGDVKIALPLGMFLGFPNVIPAFYTAFLTGAVISIILVLWGKKKFRKSTIPFGPFLVFAAGFSYFFGQTLINYFLKTFF